MSGFKGSETIELRRAGRDRFGDPIPGVTLVTFEKCAVLPREVGEDNDGGSVAIAGHQVYIPPQAPPWSADVPEADRQIKDSDQLLVRGEWTDIEGHPGRYVDLRGRERAIVVTTRGEVLA